MSGSFYRLQVTGTVSKWVARLLTNAMLLCAGYVLHPEPFFCHSAEATKLITGAKTWGRLVASLLIVCCS
jgi:hypothetical protein